MCGAAIQGARPPLGHRPAGSGTAIQCDIHGTVIFRRHRSLFSGPGIIWRKHTADQGDDGYAVAAIVAESVQIPPGIAIGPYLDVQPWSAIRQSAAICPDRLAVGIPDPGCTLPPARYRPGIFVLGPGLAKKLPQPWDA